MLGFQQSGKMESVLSTLTTGVAAAAFLPVQQDSGSSGSEDWCTVRDFRHLHGVVTLASLYQLPEVHACMRFAAGLEAATAVVAVEQIDTLFLKAKCSEICCAQDDEVREGLKEYSNWPTFPQLYFRCEGAWLLHGIQCSSSLLMSSTAQVF
jgi:glutaredoxin-related protein